MRISPEQLTSLLATMGPMVVSVLAAWANLSARLRSLERRIDGQWPEVQRRIEVLDEHVQNLRQQAALMAHQIDELGGDISRVREFQRALD